MEFWELLEQEIKRQGKDNRNKNQREQGENK